MKKNLLIVSLLALIVDNSVSQVQVDWIASYNGYGNGSDGAVCMVIDAAGNIYVTGTTTANYGNPHIQTLKYSSSGNQVWRSVYDSSTYDVPRAITIDAAGNVYIAAQTYGGVTHAAFLTIKYSPDGNEIWIRQLDGAGGDDIPAAIAVDNSGNIFVTGSSYPANGYMDYLTVKYDNSGTRLWTRRYNGPAN